MGSYLDNWHDQFRPGISRREFLRWSAVALGLARVRAQSDLWSTAEAIARRVAPPRFPDRTFDVTRYGAKPDGAADCTAAFRAAIAACHDAGGGRVIVPRGRFLTGAIRLRSKVNCTSTTKRRSRSAAIRKRTSRSCSRATKASRS